MLLPRAERERLAQLTVRDAGHGFDPLGMNADAVRAAIGTNRFFYKVYHRVRSHGAQHIPQSGPAILAANHSGMLPIDGTMLFLSVVDNTDPPRAPRPVGDVFIPFLPVVSTVYSRLGVVSGSRGNFRYLLENGELIMVFPEGARGIGKGWDKRYQLQHWHPGHAELALRFRVPVIPVGIVGAEEAWPQIARIERFRAFGVPWLPIPASPLPLPVRIDVHYGAPIYLHEQFPSERAYDPEVAKPAAGIVKHAVEQLLERGRDERSSIW